MKYVIDIDGTIFDSVIDERGDYFVESAYEDIITKINTLYLDGHEIILHTGRHWNHLNDTILQLNRYKVNYTTLIMGKPVGDVYVDDRAVRPDEWTI